MGKLKGAVPIALMGTAPFSVYRQFQRVNRVLDYLADPALPLSLLPSGSSVGYRGVRTMPCGDVLPVQLRQRPGQEHQFRLQRRRPKHRC